MKIIVSGANGVMGGHVINQAKKAENTHIAALFDAFAESGSGVYNNLMEIEEAADVLIDFSHHSLTEQILEFARARQMPIVIATTGQSEEELAAIQTTSREVPVFYSGNMSLGVAVLKNIVRQAAEAFPGADIEIVEAHHSRKEDAPSGTAIAIFNAISDVRENAQLVCGRLGKSKRTPSEIGMHSIRMGNVVGIHEVYITTETETLTLKHEAHDRAIFADGAIAAARFLAQQGPGLYDMEGMLENRE